MKLKKINGEFSVCKVVDYSGVDLSQPFCFTGSTDEEKSLVCLTPNVPANAVQRDDGWRALKVQGVLDFSLIGILSQISVVLAQNKIGIFVISTYNTDYILVKSADFERAVKALTAAGHEVE